MGEQVSFSGGGFSISYGDESEQAAEPVAAAPVARSPVTMAVIVGGVAALAVAVVVMIAR